MAADEVPSRISSPHGTITLTLGGKAIEFGVEQPQFDFSALRFTVMREPPIDTGGEDEEAARVEAFINAPRLLQAKEVRVAGADSNGSLTNNTRYYSYGDGGWTREHLAQIGLRVQVASTHRVRLYLPRSRRYDYPEVKAWIKKHAPVHVRATLYLERRR